MGVGERTYHPFEGKVIMAESVEGGGIAEEVEV